MDYIKIYNKYQLDLVFEMCIEFNSNKFIKKKGFKQINYMSSYWPRLSSEINGWIDWNISGLDLELFIRAFDNPYKGAMTNWRGEKVYIKNSFFKEIIIFIHFNMV